MSRARHETNRAKGGRTEMKVSGNPDVFKEAEDKHGTMRLIHMLRIPYESDLWVDNVTDNLLVKAYERYSFGITDPRSAWREFPTS